MFCLYFILPAGYLSHCCHMKVNCGTLIFIITVFVCMKVFYMLVITVSFFCEYLTAKTTDFIFISTFLILINFATWLQMFYVIIILWSSWQSVVGYLNNLLFSSRGISLFEFSGKCTFNFSCLLQLNVVEKLCLQLSLRQGKSILKKTSHSFIYDWDCNWVKIFENKTKKILKSIRMLQAIGLLEGHIKKGTYGKDTNG